MNIVFPSIDASYIKAKVEGGFYSNATELVRDAVRRLRELEDAKYERLMLALEVGERDIREGHTEPYTPELLDKIEKDARKHAAEGRKPNPDVCS